jgi:hypothetical protein
MAMSYKFIFKPDCKTDVTFDSTFTGTAVLGTPVSVASITSPLRAIVTTGLWESASRGDADMRMAVVTSDINNGV